MKVREDVYKRQVHTSEGVWERGQKIMKSSIVKDTAAITIITLVSGLALGVVCLLYTS